MIYVKNCSLIPLLISNYLTIKIILIAFKNRDSPILSPFIPCVQDLKMKYNYLCRYSTPSMVTFVKMHKKLILVVFVFILISSCKNGKKDAFLKNGPPPKTLVDVIIAQPSTVSTNVEANGTVISNEYVELHAEVSGRLTYLNVPEGKFIQKGTLIARINDADLQAQLNKSKVLLDLAQKTEERLRKLLALNGVNQADYDAALNAVNGYKADIAYTQSLIDKTIIKAPFSGVIGLRQVSPGAYLTPANIIATIQQLDKIKIDFTIPEEFSNLIKKQATVEVETDEANQSRKKAVIIATEPQVNQNTRNLKVRAILQGSKINPGAFVKVYVASSLDKKAIMVPTSSIIANDLNKQLIVVRKGKALFTDVVTGLREEDNVEIIKGVNAGDSIVVTGVLFARPNSPLKVRSVKNLAKLSQ
jgi:membrane fusion protein (multidrug efflux system)